MSTRFAVVTFVSAALIGVVPFAGHAFTTKKDMRVNPVNNAVFELVSSRSAKGFEYWCAVSDYARRGLDVPWTTSVYVVRGRGQSQTTGRRSSVQFTFDPDAAGLSSSQSYESSDALAVGDMMTVQQAHAQCQGLSGRY